MIGPLRLMTVPSTGTRFLLELLRANGFTAAAQHWKRRYETPEGLLIAPIRDPSHVWATWVRERRGPPYYGIVNFEYAWGRFNECFETKKDFYVVPVDTLDFRLYLDYLSWELGRELTWDWVPPREPFPDPIPAQVDLYPIYTLPLVRQFYPEWEPWDTHDAA